MKIHINDLEFEQKRDVSTLVGLDKNWKQVTISFERSTSEILHLRKDYGVLRIHDKDEYKEKFIDPKSIGEELYNLLNKYSFRCIKEGNSVNNNFFTEIYIYTKDYLIKLDFLDWISDEDVFNFKEDFKNGVYETEAKESLDFIQKEISFGQNLFG